MLSSRVFYYFRQKISDKTLVAYSLNTFRLLQVSYTRNKLRGGSK